MNCITELDFIFQKALVLTCLCILLLCLVVSYEMLVGVCHRIYQLTAYAAVLVPTAFT